jgi:hypothetical protein
MVFAATVAVGLLAVVAIFQVALALGAPFGKAAWGGAHDGVLPTRLRGASAFVGLVVYPVVIAVVLSASGVIDADLVPGRGAVTMWVLATIFLLGAMANAVSRSRVERWWAPVSLSIALCCAAMAVSL